MIFKKQTDVLFGRHDRLFRVYSKAAAPASFKLLRARLHRLQHTLLRSNQGGRFLLRTIEGMMLLQFDLYNYNDLAMLSEIEAAGVYERATTLYVKDQLKKGDSFLDIGANIGYYSILASRLVGEKGRVWALEPVAETVDRLKQNLILNDANNVSLITKAAYSSSGSVTMYLSDVQDGMNSTLSTVKHSASVSVGSITIDDLIASEDVSMLKLDVEGAESEVLAGAEVMLSSGNCDKVIVEWYNHEFTSEALAHKFLDYSRIGPLYVIGDSQGPRGYVLRGPISDRRYLPPYCNLVIFPARK